jgi:diadenylate cyclase
VISEVVRAAVELSKRRVGALVAIQREVGLGVYIEHGVRLDAEISAETLWTIFTSTGPLHDGAVILRQGRIAAAGCLFPLTENPDLSRTLGTRHRAAIGVTEDSDAVAVVVSEETGRISLGLEGELREGLTPEELRAQLLELCPAEEAGRETEVQ